MEKSVVNSKEPKTIVTAWVGWLMYPVLIAAIAILTSWSSSYLAETSGLANYSSHASVQPIGAVDRAVIAAEIGCNTGELRRPDVSHGSGGSALPANVRVATLPAAGYTVGSDRIH
jgi:hypothetical protein